MRQAVDSSLPTQPLSPRIVWIIFAIFAGTFVLIFPDTFKSLHHKWTQWDGAYSHGYLLVVVCLYFIAKELPSRIHISKFSILYFSLVALPSALWSFGYATQIEVLSQLTVPLMIAVWLLCVVGFKNLRFFLMPLGLMYLSIPVWEVLLPLLRNLTTFVAVQGVRILDVPAFIDGYSFSLPYGTVVIAGSCAGLSYFLMGLALSSLNVMYRDMPFKYGAISIVLLTVMAIIGNWIRVFALILIAYYSKMQNPLVEEHGNFGWMIFAGIFVLFLFLTRHFPEGSPKDPSDAIDPKSFMQLLGLTTVVLLVLAVMPRFLTSQTNDLSDNIATISTPSLEALPADVALRRMQFDYRGYDSADVFTTSVKGKAWQVGRITYVQQKQGKELISDSHQMTKLKTRTLSHVMDDGTEVVLEIHEGKQAKLFLWVYLIGERMTTDPLQGKLWQFTERLKDRAAVALWFASQSCQTSDCSQEIDTLTSDAVAADLLEPLKLY